MTIAILRPNEEHCRPFWVASQLESGAWGWGNTETEARARMMELQRNGRLIYKPELEEYREGVHDVPVSEERLKNATSEH